MAATHFDATYIVESPLPPERVAAMMAGEQSCGTFTPVPGETDALRERAGARVVEVADLGPRTPSLPSAYLARRGIDRPSRAARVRLRFPIANVGANLSTLAAIVAGNLFDLGEVTGLRLTRLDLPATFRDAFLHPSHGIAGTRRATGVQQGAMLGTIIKPNVGFSPEETAEVVRTLCAAGVDFIKDDEICADPDHAPLRDRVPAVMRVVREHREATGKQVMVAFNITGETDAMRRHAELVCAEGGTCVMVSANWCGFSAVETLRRSTDLAIHAHRNGFGMFSRAPALGMDVTAYQALWRLAGIDHFHVHGLQGKFAQDESEVIDGALACFAPMGAGDDRVLPAVSSGQWAGTVAPTYAAFGSDDVLFMAGGGILGHPDGAVAGVESLRDAWSAALAGEPLETARLNSRALSRAIDHFGGSA